MGGAGRREWKMKITKLKTYICNCFRTNWVFVKVETDSGIHGWGEATLEYREPTVAAAIHDLEGWLIGRDPHNIEAFRQSARRSGLAAARRQGARRGPDLRERLVRPGENAG